MPAKPTSELNRRRNRNCVLLVLALLLLAVVVNQLNRSLWHSAFSTGYLLLGSFFVLTLFGMRKRLSFIANIGSASFWMQLHIYVGLATFGMFAMHVSWRVPDGIFESVLTVLFLIVSLSGVYGLIISRTYPAKLTSIGSEVVYEEIPRLRVQMAAKARQLILQADQSADVLGQFYVNRLAAFLETPRRWSYFVNPNGRLKRQLVSDIADLNRYLAIGERQVGQQLSEIVEQRGPTGLPQRVTRSPEGLVVRAYWIHLQFVVAVDSPCRDGSRVRGDGRMIKKTSFPSKSQPAPTSYQRPHDQWQEVVVQAGGADDDQGKVVRKARSIRWQRWMFTLSVTAFTFGALMIGFATPSIRNEIIAPGELCSSHAQILAGQGVDRCAACHPGGDQSFSQWASSAVFGANAELPTQSELCMKCHEQSFDKQWAMSPHNVDPKVLSSKLNSELNAKPVSFAAKLDGLTRLPSPTDSGEMACSVCHREHHGSKNDLTALHRSAMPSVPSKCLPFI